MEENFNLFKNLRLNENQHSNFLKKLLTVSGKHGQGDLFLKSFLEMIDFPYNNEVWKVGKELQSGKKGRIDLIIYTENKSIIIENKINNAENQKNQLYRYWKNSILNKNISESRILYLAKSRKDKDYEKHLEVSKQKPINPTYNKLTHLPEVLEHKVEILGFKEDIIPWLKCCLSNISNDNCTDESLLRLKYTLEQYIEFLENHL